MSLRDPDALGRSISARVKPYLFVIYVIGLGSAPVIAWIAAQHPETDYSNGGVILLYVLLSTAAGIFIYYLPGGRNGLTVAAYWVAYGAGLFLILGSTTPVAKGSTISQGLVVAIPFYLVAACLLTLHRMRVAAIKETTANGVTTTATITSAGVDGMINYVQHQRLTLKFTDQQGRTRWLRIGRTGGGYAVGDTIPIRYDPARPGLKRGIVVGP
jgi:hypothetical protein